MDSKWQARWAEEGEFEANPDDRPKKFITVAYPYPNSPQHIGHGRTYTLADVHARFMRMQGNNVLFPMGFHYTGTPILGMARRIERHDDRLIENLEKLYGVPADIIPQFADPVKIADYFHEEIKSGMLEMGYSIDWRREFTTIDPAYQAFIRWQIQRLHSRGLVVQGSHPVGWCPRDQNPVSQHDTLGDVEPDFTEYVLVKFTVDDYVVPTATLRPETLFGVVNLWVNPELTYEKVLVDGQKWLVSDDCAYKLGFLGRTVSRTGQIRGADLVGRTAIMPHTKKPVPILPAAFVEGRTGTGMVMSVPAHAPFDFVALENAKASDDTRVAELASHIDHVPIIQSPEYGMTSARHEVLARGITKQDDPRLEEATKAVYGKEFYSGKLLSNTGDFAGMRVETAKDAVAEWLAGIGHAETMLELTNAPVRCRCGAQCVVKMLDDQWFLNYGDADWKESAIKCLESMSILPAEIRGEFEYVVGWLRHRACARQHGLGTRLPMDKDWIVESLSDSVIYMAYYVLSRFVNDGTLVPEAVSDAFLDHVFLGYGDAGSISQSTGIPADTIRAIRNEFEYFYPVDSRHSGRDLVPNHLTFFVLNHTAIFPSDLWPRQIVVNGSVLMKGSKMSKSMGNIIPLRDAVRKYGADPIRLAIIISAELLQDADFDPDSISGLQCKLEEMLAESAFYATASPYAGPTGAEDRWLVAQLQALVDDVTAALEMMRLREALHHILYDFEAKIAWFRRRAAAKGRTDTAPVLRHVLCTRIMMLSPFAPHAAEEMWESLGNSDMVSRAAWPVHQDTNRQDLLAEALLSDIISDIRSILRITRREKADSIYIYTAGRTYYAAYLKITRMILHGDTDMRQVMKNLVADPESVQIKKNPKFVQKAIKSILSTPLHLREAVAESELFSEASFLRDELALMIRTEFDASDVRIFSADDEAPDDPGDKARHAMPFRPAIFVK